MLNFNKQQQDVIQLSEGRHACIASAGSGKTEVLTERLKKALSDGVNPEKILCITFTNRAALSMYNRVSGKVHLDVLKKMFIGNSHALALKLLRESKYFPYSKKLCLPDISNYLWRSSEKTIKINANNYFHYKSHETAKNTEYSFNEEILIQKNAYSVGNGSSKFIEYFNSDEFKKIIKTLEINAHDIKSNDLKFIVNGATLPSTGKQIKIDYRKIYSIIQPLLEDAISNISLRQDYINFATEKINLIYEETEISKAGISLYILVAVSISIGNEYRRLKENMFLYDYDDALCCSIKVEPKKYSWIQIDECQDLSPMQWLIIRYHISDDSHVLMLGDINQSIYRFLGASIEVTDKELGSSRFELSINYRSPQNLVDFFKKYMSLNFPQRFHSEIRSAVPLNQNALIHIHRSTEEAQLCKMLQHALKLAAHKKNIAFLCPTNALVDEVSDIFQSNEIRHFKVSKDDILTSKSALDFISFVHCLNDDSDHIAWARLLWNLAGNYLSENLASDTLTPQLKALSIVSELVKCGGKISDFSILHGYGEKFFTDFIRACEEGYVFFDTETTGLNADDNIIQIAAIYVKDSEVERELDLYCLSDKSVHESEHIHKISDEKLKSIGLDFNLQFENFFSFVRDKTLIAHNLSFDKKMIKSNLLKNNNKHFENFNNLKMLCTLELSRRLFPNLKSHRLEYLLNEFKIDGVNSHNALDDVRAGANFLEFVRAKIKEKLFELTELTNKIEDCLRVFTQKATILFGEFEKIKNSNVDLEDIFDLYFHTVISNNLHDINSEQVKELRDKLIKWSKENLSRKEFGNFVSDTASILQTIKESDLILDDDNLVISTIHKSKGLEFEYVFLPSVIDSNYPPYPLRAMIDNDEKLKLIQEQKRLLYVGMTRAKKQLIIGTCENNNKGFQTSPSDFIIDLLAFMKKF